MTPRVTFAAILLRNSKLAGRVANRTSQWSERESVLLALANDTHVGFGEAAPLPGFSHENIADVLRALQDLVAQLDPAGEGESIAPTELFARMASRFAHAWPRVSSAQFAVESALWMLHTRSLARTEDALGQLLQGLTPAPPSAQCCWLLGGGACAPEQWADLAARALQRGVPGAVKVKVASTRSDFSSELSGIRALRAVLGPAVELRTDANGGFALLDAPARMRALADAGADSLEEPCPAHDLRSVDRGPLRFYLDESLADHTIAHALVDQSNCAGLVLKPAVVGGWVRAMDLARAAARRGIPCAISHIFDGPVAMQALRTLQPHVPACTLPSALDAHEGSAVDELAATQLSKFVRV
ncbi:MAG: enolase C-terminal domain-like protein [Deltaproteobacteria bacterium]|nr:enolase C-terminal domain-like protein [Deltaproteobacteria bacterium]